MPTKRNVELRAGGGDTRCQRFEPGADTAAEEAHSDEHYDRDRGDQQAVFDDNLAVLGANELTNRFHALEPPEDLVNSLNFAEHARRVLGAEPYASGVDVRALDCEGVVEKRLRGLRHASCLP